MWSLYANFGQNIRKLSQLWFTRCCLHLVSDCPPTPAQSTSPIRVGESRLTTSYAAAHFECPRDCSTKADILKMRILISVTLPTSQIPCGKCKFSKPHYFTNPTSHLLIPTSHLLNPTSRFYLDCMLLGYFLFLF